ncbi:MAG TPA: hypothetical protein VNY35_00215 [Solirubrobacteraceae bacterium]|nr:hypothetical protein [Solirubrobacteraceae bacterium]
MRAHDVHSQLAARALAKESAADPFSEAAGGGTLPRVTELVGQAQEAARGMIEAEDALRLVSEHFERTDDPEARGELAAEALDHVERQLRLTRQRRQGLDSIEGKLWSRRNALERFLIQTRGRAWWRARVSPTRPGTRTAERI